MKSVNCHRINFYEPKPHAIRFFSYDETISRLAVLRADYSIEIWDMKETPYQEKIIPGDDKVSIETLSWCQGRLFAAGLHGYVLEYDLNLLLSKSQILVTSGCPIWCMDFNVKKTHLAVGNEEGYISLLEVTPNGLHFEKSFNKQEGSILCLDWHKKGKIIATGSLDAIRTWDVSTGHVLNRIMLGRSSKKMPTVVWCLAFLSDMTLVSGDSNGRVSFWDGNIGTLLSDSGSRKEDILSLAVTKKEDVIYASGVEPTITSYMQSQSNGMWMKSVQRVVHTHDVRALQIVGDFLVSGGDDCNLVCSKYPPKTVLTFYPYCQKSSASVAEEVSCLLLQYQRYLDLWKIGDQNSLVHLLKIKTKANEKIISSSISNNGNWIAYSTLFQVRLFNTNVCTNPESVENPSVSKIEISSAVPPSRVLLFNKDSSKLICYGENKIVIVNCNPDFSNIEATINLDKDTSRQIHLMALSSDESYLACGSHDGNIIIYCFKSLKFLCKLPLYKYQPTALSFDSSSENIVVTYSDRKIVEYNVTKQAYTLWSKQEMLQELKMSSLYPISSIKFFANKLLLLEENTLFIIDKTNEVSPSKKKKKQSDGSDIVFTENKFDTITKYEHISSVHSMNGDLVLVQIPSKHILSSLPPPVWKKIYGT